MKVFCLYRAVDPEFSKARKLMRGGALGGAHTREWRSLAFMANMGREKKKLRRHRWATIEGGMGIPMGDDTHT